MHKQTPGWDYLRLRITVELKRQQVLRPKQVLRTIDSPQLPTLDWDRSFPEDAMWRFFTLFCLLNTCSTSSFCAADAAFTNVCTAFAIEFAAVNICSSNVGTSSSVCWNIICICTKNCWTMKIKKFKWISSFVVNFILLELLPVAGVQTNDSRICQQLGQLHLERPKNTNISEWHLLWQLSVESNDKYRTSKKN